MAKNSFPMMPTSGGGGLSKVVGLLVMAVIAIALVKNPTGAADVVRTVVDAVVTFVSTVAS